MIGEFVEKAMEAGFDSVDVNVLVEKKCTSHSLDEVDKGSGDLQSSF